MAQPPRPLSLQKKVAETPRHQPRASMLLTAYVQELELNLTDGKPFAWDEVIDATLSGRPARRYRVRLADRHIGIPLPMGGQIIKTDVGRVLYMDEYLDGDCRVLDYIE